MKSFEQPQLSEDEKVQQIVDEFERQWESERSSDESIARFRKTAEARVQMFVDAGRISKEYAEAFLQHRVGIMTQNLDDNPEQHALKYVNGILEVVLNAKEQVERKIEELVVPWERLAEEAMATIEDILVNGEYTESVEEKLVTERDNMREQQKYLAFAREQLEELIERIMEVPKPYF